MAGMIVAIGPVLLVATSCFSLFFGQFSDQARLACRKTYRTLRVHAEKACWSLNRIFPANATGVIIKQIFRQTSVILETTRQKSPKPSQRTLRPQSLPLRPQRLPIRPRNLPIRPQTLPIHPQPSLARERERIGQ
jgi:hypothetical protein